MNAIGKLAVAAGLALLPATALAADADKLAVLETYTAIAHAGYEDSLITAKALQGAVDALIANPSEAKLTAAREAWVAARVPYQQTEVYRFGNAVVDDWEGKVNAWPLDEGLIDYVDSGLYGAESDENPIYTANVIANKSLTVNGARVDASVITKTLLSDVLHEAEEVEANVSTGYHAIEFLLWGQDLNGTGPGAGQRPASDFSTAACTNGNCDRRAAYLKAATNLLIDDLMEMTALWAPDGAARKGLLTGNADAGISTILTGMGSLSYGELAGERIKLGLMLHDPEEEHDCFSDNTHNSHFYNQLGIINVYRGSYRRIDGSVVSGASLSGLVAAKDAAVDNDLQSKLEASRRAMQAMVDRAEGGEAYDQMIGEGNAAGNAVVETVVQSLTAQTRPIERAVAVLSLGQIDFEGSDSLDNPTAIFQ
ncbi:peptidase [Pelagibius litoralis]|uniref:Peptidase n=1 Tax=Pelagibius litoralis TaxID=374515 RepID=A0A967K7X0_9PROT|nr:imelysin family protein [Pelagibius litoralis]NIA70093.1 peptidase [Pelagibius litoralis]